MATETPPAGLDSAMLEEALRLAGVNVRQPGRFERYRHDPVGFCKDVLGFAPWGADESPTRHPGQVQILRDLWEHRFVVVASCNNAGKTMLAAHAAIAFLQCIPNSIVLSTAPTWEQVEDLLWRHIREAWRGAKEPLLGKPLTTSVEIAPRWFAKGLSTNEEERFQGHHPESDGAMLVIVDEAAGIKEQIWNALLGYLTGSNVYMLWIGNPNRAEGPAFQAFTTGRWVVPFKGHKIAARDVPPSILTDPDWARRMEEDFGPDHPQVRIRVHGEYVAGTTDQLFPTWLLDLGQDLRHPMVGDGVHMGLDVARHGSDATVATLIDRGEVVAVESWNSPDLTETARNVATLAEAWRCKSEHIHIDIGMGAGVADRLAEAGLSVDLVDWGSEPAGDWQEFASPDMKFKNRKAEMHWTARQLLAEKRLAIPAKWRQTRRQLGWILYDFDESQRMFIEPKKTLKTRTGGESPDFADSLVLALSRSGGWSFAGY